MMGKDVGYERRPFGANPATACPHGGNPQGDPIMTGVVPVQAAPVESEYLGADTRPQTGGWDRNDPFYVTFA